MLFLSHSGADSAAAKELARRLREAGLDVWLDLDNLQPGDAWMAKLEEALQQASAFAVYVGPSGIERWVDREVRAALERSTADPSFRIIPILGEGAADPQKLPYFLRQHQAVNFRRESWVEDLKRLVGAVRSEQWKAVSLLRPDEDPFQGLAYFDVAHAHLFFGRDEVTQELLEKLRTDRFLAVVGASGSGKSSLVRAGLVPALHRGRFQNSGSLPALWRIAICRPGGNPFAELAEALPHLNPQMSSTDSGKIIEDSKQRLRHGVDGLRTSIAVLVPPGHRTLLVVDQFEELFTLTSSQEERRQFVDTLLGITAGAGDRPVNVLITLRADFYSRCWEHPELPGRIAQNQHAARPLPRAQLKEAIEKPLALAGAVPEPGLVDIILREAGDEPGSLPLVEHALLQLWNRRQGNRLTHAAYEKIGGVSGALVYHAEDVFARLNEDERQIAQKIFLRLTQPGEGTEDTRRRAGRDEIVALGGDEQMAEQVLAKLAAAEARLVVTRREGESNVVEVAHEALIRGWPRLREWIDANRAAIRIERRLIEASAEWAGRGRDPDLLHPGVHLIEAEEWARQNSRDLRQQEREFLEASIEARDRAVREAEERRQRELEMAEARASAEKQIAEVATAAARRSRRLVRLLAGVAMVAIGAALLALFMWRESILQAAAAESHQLTAASHAVFARDPTAALLFALRATNRTPTVEAIAALAQAVTVPTARAVLQGHDSFVLAAAFSPDGMQVVTGSHDTSVRLWDAQTGEEQWVLWTRQIVYDAGFSPDGMQVVTAGRYGGANLWDARTGEHRKGLGCHAGAVYTAAFSPDGMQVVTGGHDGAACLFDAQTGELQRMLWRNVGPRGEYGNPVLAAAVSPDGRQVVTARGGGTADLWDVHTGEEQRVLRGHTGSVTAAAFSPDGRQVLTASGDGTARLWDAQTGEMQRLLAGTPGPRGVQENPVTAAAFSPNGRQVLTASRDGTARLWDAQTGVMQSVLRGHEGGITAAAFSGDGRQVVTSSDDGTTRLWDAQTREEEKRLGDYRDPRDEQGNPVDPAASSIDVNVLLDIARARIPVTLAPAVKDSLMGHVGRRRTRRRVTVTMSPH